MVANPSPNQPIAILRDTIVGAVRSESPDLTTRQLAVFLISYLEEGPHTVRGLAARLQVSKPAVTRALDRLEELNLAHRKVDPMDRRSILVQRTERGVNFLKELDGYAQASAKITPASKSKTT